MKRQRHITIAGAGLVGSLLSVMLGKLGYEVTIFERRPDMRGQDVDAGRSINLALSSRGIFALQQAELLDQVSRLLIPMRGRMLHMEDGSQEFMAYGQREHEMIYSVSRRDLNCLMMTAAELAEPVNVIFNQQCEAVDFESRRLQMRNAVTGESRSEPFDILIGADGAGSRVRRAMIPFVGGHSQSDFLDHDYKELEIPSGPGESFQIEKEALHIWPRGGYMLIALPNQDGSFTVTLFLARQGNPSFESIGDPDRLHQFFMESFPDAVKLIPDLESDFFSHPQGPLGTLRCSPWYCSDHTLILGDASHAIVPFHGQGMNSGFEDCSELIRLLEQFDHDWTQVLPEFDRIRKPNADAIADMALENYITMRESVADAKFQLKKELGFELERRFPRRFIPRYSMVMFHLIPYSEAFRRGEIQQSILDELTTDTSNLDSVDFERAASLVLRKLPELDGID